MKRLATLPLLVPVAVLCLGLAALGGWWLHRSRGEAGRALATLKQKQQEWEHLVHQIPALIPQNEAALSTQLASAHRSLVAWRLVLQGDESRPLAAPAPVTSIEAFFELADLVEQLRAKAGQAQVGLRPGERFGFATHTNEGPAGEQIAVVHRQRIALGYLVEMLLEARPLALLAVRRERHGAAVSRDQRGATEDFFELDHFPPVRQPGRIESEAFRFEFTGRTATLRHFLNSLGSCRQPVVVRSVEVEPLVADHQVGGGIAAGLLDSHDAALPLVKPGPSKFGVILEFAWLVDNPAAAAP